MEIATASYAAGLIDGEGSFHLSQTRYSVELRVRMTSLATMVWLKSNFGGTFHHEKRRPNRKQTWLWELGNTEALLAMLTICRPYMIEKRERAERVIEFLHVAKNTPPRFEARREAWNKLEGLNSTP